MTEGPTFTDWKSIIWVIRIYAVIIIAAILIADFTAWLSTETLTFIIMLMALFTLSATLQPYLATHRRAMMGILVGLVVLLLLLGIIVFFLAM
jgi:hypothetical protein